LESLAELRDAHGAGRQRTSFSVIKDGNELFESNAKLAMRE
jgi:hypothetical protein